MSDLRARQKALARRSILDALAGLISERQHLDFSVQEVADRAGVSLRTVYNHFASREALLEGLVEHFNTVLEEQGGVLIGSVPSAWQLRDAAAVNFRLFEANSALAEAWQQLSRSGSAGRADFDARTTRMLQLIAEELPDADGTDVRAVGSVIRHLCSQVTWWGMTRGLGLTTEETVGAVTWAADVLLAAAAAGDLPSAPDHDPPPRSER